MSREEYYQECGCSKAEGHEKTCHINDLLYDFPVVPQDHACDHGNATSFPVSTCKMTPYCPAAIRLVNRAMREEGWLAPETEAEVVKAEITLEDSSAPTWLDCPREFLHRLVRGQRG
jgi:hypothetical protein